jgi:putative membrane protein
MLFELLLALLLGILFGTFTGLIPGIHINLVGIFIISIASTKLSYLNPIYFAIFIVSMAITHTFLDFIPSVFLGCPDTDTELSILPGHELLKRGLGYEAVVLTAYGSIAAILILILISFPAILVVKKLYEILLPLTAYLLIGITILLVFIERKKFSAFLVILLTGILGIIVLNISVKEPLLPLLSGLFGSSMLIMSIKNKTKIPKQKITKPKVKLFRPLLSSFIAAPLCSFLPGMGSGQAALIGSLVSKTERGSFLVLLGATNTLVMGFSFLSLYTISKTRTGATVAIKEIIGIPSEKILILILIVTLISGIISFFLTISLAKLFSTKIGSLNYSLLSSITLFVLILVIFLVSGYLGILVFLISTLTGIFCISLEVKRTHMMGCLLIPTILFYLF